MLSNFKSAKEKIKNIFGQDELFSRLEGALKNIEDYLEQTYIEIQERKAETFPIKIKKLKMFFSRVETVFDLINIEGLNNKYMPKIIELREDVEIKINKIKVEG